MNQKLQNILEIIQLSEKLDAEQKDALLKTVKDADKELEITAFKLERTEKVKKTTAILLEETIEELEQKRKAVEAQNRELEIEGSLERVRAAALGMNTLPDLMEVGKILFIELKALGFDSVRNTQIDILNDEKKSFLNYEYFDYGVSGVTEVFYDSHPIVTQFVNDVRSAPDALSFKEVTGRELDEWREHRKKNNHLPDAELEKATSLYYYYYSIGTVALGISSFEAINEEKLELLKRFRNVFELAYRRFTDIALAEAQAREAQIEASLERVRSVAMGMNKSDDLLSICEISFKEFQKLGFNNLRNAIIHILNDEKGFFLDYDFSDFMGGSITNISYNSHPVVENYLKQIKSAEDAFAEVVIEGNQLSDWKKFRRESGQHDDNRLDDIPALYYYFHSIGVGDIGISTFKPIDESQIKILKRFRNVFDLAYRTYTDITKAEAQAREAQIEAALERVRSRSMGMQKSEELKEVIQVVYEQFVHLNIHIEHTGFIMDYKSRDDMHIWLADRNEVPSEVTIPYFDCAHWNSFIEAKEKGIDFFANLLTFEEKNRFYKDLFKLIPGVPEKTLEYYFSCPGLAISTVLLENVGLYIENFSGIPYSDEENKTLMRFGKVFQQTYTRFLDLQKAEVQAREAQIETALDRVRGKAMAMHKSEDISSAVASVFTELDTLGLSTLRCGIGIFDRRSDNKVEVWTTSTTEEENLVQVKGDELLEGHPLLEGIYDAWQQQKNYSYVLVGKDIEHYYNVVAESNLQLPQQKIDPDNLESARQYYYCAMFPAGGLFAFKESEFSEEDIQVIQRFADVFHLTFIRHLDLKQAEAQNKIIQAENERKTEELEEARKLQLAMLPKELPKLPNLDIAVFMQTATEVGGDYYDFKVGMDGTLTTIIGDATGHGMKAGTVVTITKSLFNSMEVHENILGTFDKISQVIKDMKFRQLAMCLLMLKIKGNRLSMSSAAMPPALIYRAKDKIVEEILLKGLPLGTMKNFPYKKIEGHLNRGDRILLYSDGLPELADDKGQMYGYERIITEFQSIGEKEPEEIVDHLKNSASQWANGKEPDDDVTFVVIKIK